MIVPLTEAPGYLLEQSEPCSQEMNTDANAYVRLETFSGNINFKRF